MVIFLIEQREYAYSELESYLQTLASKYTFLQLTKQGRTIGGRPIYMVKLGNGSQNVLYTGGFHGSERLTVLSLIMFLEELCEALVRNQYYSISNARSALKGKTLYFIPCVNPDGYEIARAGVQTAGEFAERIEEILDNNDYKYWNANLNGIDINHNFNAGFEQLKELERADGIFGPSPRRYGGISPESEIETQILTSLCREISFNKVLAMHSQGEEIYWQFGENTPESGLRLAELFATASGYRVAEPSGTASYGGFKDWFIDEFARPGFTIEIGKGENPLPPSTLYAIYERLKELFLISFAI